MANETTTANDEKVSALEAKVAALEAKLAALETDCCGEDESCGESVALVDELKEKLAALHDDLKPFILKYRAERDDVMRAAGEKICEHPFVSLAAAFTAGVVIAKALETKVYHSDFFHRS